MPIYTRSRRARAVLLLASFAVALLGSVRPSSVRAEVSTEADGLKLQGDAAMDSLRFEDALAAYASAYERSHDPALLYNQGRAYEALGRHPEALRQLEAFAQVAPPNLKSRVPRLQELIESLRGKVGKLLVTCDVAGARVLVRGTQAGQTPLAEPLELTAGPSVAVEVVANGYLPFRREVEVPPRGLAKLDVALVPAHGGGLLRIETTPPGADLLVGGKPAGIAPALLPLPPGTHAVRASRPGYRDAETSAYLAAGEERTLRIALTARQPLTRTWWFWTAVGTVVAASIVTAVALSTERSPSSGSIKPGLISEPVTIAGTP